MMMRYGLLLAISLGGSAIAKDRAPVERVVPPGGMVSASVAGKPVTLRLEPGAPGVPLLTVAAADRIGLDLDKMGFGLGYAVGGQSAVQATKVLPIDLGTGAFKRRVGFPGRPRGAATDRPRRSYANAGDGSVGPGSLPEPVVRFKLREARPGERTVALPLDDGGGLFGRFTGLFAVVSVGGQPMRVRLDPYRPRSIANASAGLRIASAQGGRMTGATVPVEIAFGIERPVRTMTLATPLVVGSLALATLGVRTGDLAGDTQRVAAIPDADAAVVAPDPDEIVVTAKGKADPKRDRLTLGADVLSRCSAIVFDKPAKQVRLTCG